MGEFAAVDAFENVGTDDLSPLERPVVPARIDQPVADAHFVNEAEQLPGLRGNRLGTFDQRLAKRRLEGAPCRGQRADIGLDIRRTDGDLSGLQEYRIRLSENAGPDGPQAREIHSSLR